MPNNMEKIWNSGAFLRNFEFGSQAGKKLAQKSLASHQIIRLSLI